MSRSERTLYRELIDAGFSEQELETRIGWGETIATIYQQASQDGYLE